MMTFSDLEWLSLGVVGFAVVESAFAHRRTRVQLRLIKRARAGCPDALAKLDGGASPLLSRPSGSNPLGPCDARMETTVPDEIAEEFIAVARMNGKTKAEWLRDLIIKSVRGEFEWMRLRAGLVDRKTENDRG